MLEEMELKDFVLHFVCFFLANVRGRELRLGSPPSSGRFLDLSNCAKPLGKSFSTFFAGCVFLIFWFIFYDSTHFFYELDDMFGSPSQWCINTGTNDHGIVYYSVPSERDHFGGAMAK